jgi:hypothetical protein
VKWSAAMVESAAAFPAARKFSRRSGNGVSISIHQPLTSPGKAAWKGRVPPAVGRLPRLSPGRSQAADQRGRAARESGRCVCYCALAGGISLAPQSGRRAVKLRALPPRGS